MSEIERLVQAMHDSLCQCGGWCEGAQEDFEFFTKVVKDRWGSLYPFELHLKILLEGV